MFLEGGRREEAERAGKATGELRSGPGIKDDGYFIILLSRLEACMESKGYHRIRACQGNDQKVMEPCMYP
jgi:hypothetical protein